jgi:hypothetical protein
MTTVTHARQTAGGARRTAVGGGGRVVGMDADPYVLLRKLPFPIARIVEGALAADGIDADVREGLGRVYGVDAGPFSTRLYVRRSQVPQAEQLLAELEAEHGQA